MLINNGKLKVLLILFSIIICFTSCSNFFYSNSLENIEEELSDKTRGDEEPGISGQASAYVKLNVLGYTDSLPKNSRTLMPPREDGSSVSKYVLYGLLKSSQISNYEINDEKQELGTWTDFSQMSSDSVAVIPGVWDFFLIAFKTVGENDKVYAIATISDQTVDSESGSSNLDFVFTFEGSDFTSGSLSVSISVPYSQVSRALVSLYNYNSSNEKVFQDLSTSEYRPSGGAEGQNSSFTISESDIPVGYYFLKVDFYTETNNTPSASRVQYVKILGGQNTSGDLTYTQLNNSYSIIYHDEITGDTEEVVNNDTNPSSYNASTSVTLAEASCQHYVFGGWYESSDCTGSPLTSWTAGSKSENVVLYAKWTPKSYPVIFHDWAGGQIYSKDYSGGYDGFETSSTAASGYCLSYNTSVPSSTFDSVTNALSDSNTIEFVGWFTNQDCTSAAAIPATAKVNDSILADTDGDGEKDSLDLYAKWNYSFIYVDPAERNTSWTAVDSNRGFSPSQALVSIEEAKNYLQGNDKARVLYLLSTAELNNSASINNPSGISDKSSYGDGTNSVVVKRHSTLLDQPLFNVTSESSTITLRNVIIDGGAVWDENGAAGTNSGLVSTSVLINAYHTAYKTNLLLDENVILQNNQNTSTYVSIANRGSGILITGTLTSNSKTNQIRTCYGSYGSAIEAVSNSTVNFYKGVIGGSSAADANYSTYSGAALNCDYAISPTTEGSTVILGAESNASDGSDLVISYNKCGRDGVLSIYGTSSLEAYNITLSNNSGNENCSGLFVGKNSSAELTGALIRNNEVSSSGKGACVCVKDNSTLSMSDVEISSNIHSNGAASGIYSDNALNKIILNNVTLKDNSCSGLGSDIHTSGNVYLSGKNTLGNVYLSSSSAKLYPRNYYDASYTGDTSVSSPLQAGSGSYVARVTLSRTLPTAEYDSSDSATYIQLLDERNAGDMTGLSSLFILNVSTHAINSEGRVVLRGSNYNNNISDPSENQLYFGINTNSISSSASQPVITITAYSDSARTVQATSASSWWCSLLYNSLTDTGAELNNAATAGAEKTINFYTDGNVNFQPGTYTLTVGASVNGTAYSDSFTITVS